jgi:hypothetical protein
LEISMRFPSGSLKYTDVISPAAPVHLTGPSRTSTPLDPRCFDDFGHRHVREEAQVGRTRGGRSCLGLEFPARLVQVDLLRTERQGVAALAEDDGLHAEHPLIEVAGG